MGEGRGGELSGFGSVKKVCGGGGGGIRESRGGEEGKAGGAYRFYFCLLSASLTLPETLEAICKYTIFVFSLW